MIVNGTKMSIHLPKSINDIVQLFYARDDGNFTETFAVHYDKDNRANILPLSFSYRAFNDLAKAHAGVLC